ncbi:MAG TPA: type I DNA topoisomerase [Bacteroidia bacterium]|jgi:DNA topoisomerase-1|nr:type I DNA topoisomerase [Bacteroidia bacterium]
MSKNLVIVESPAKAKTIEGFLGKDYTVRSSFGHIRDLVKKGYGVDIENNFTPTYEVQPDKEKIIAELKKLSKGADMVWLASDEDREGEAISWHLSEALDLNPKKTKRIVFHEITKGAIEKAIKNPRGIDINLVNAQQARRVLDRLVGFELSPILWRKVRPSLSAGRVQSVAVRLIVEREREIQNFKSTSAFKVSALFKTGTATLKAELDKRFTTEPEAQKFLEKCKAAAYSIGTLETKPAKRSPAAPFTTSTLQQEAARKLGFSVSQTMMLAQRLYEAGKITYMRTDSVNLSETAINQANEAINKNYGKKYYQPRVYKTKSKGAQEAHEAIRPTYINVLEVEGDRNEVRLYDLIWKRTIASQMSDAELEKTTAKITISTTSEIFVAQGEVLKFDGFLKVYMEGKDDEDAEETEDENSSMLPPLKVGDKLQSKEIIAQQRFTHHPPRYTEASLVKKLEELGIGRPSTYAPTISTVQKRNYVEKTDREGTPRNYSYLVLAGGNIKKETKTENTGAEKSKLFPTDIGMVVNDFLLQHFPEILDFHFTAKVEEEFDEIAEGKLNWTKMLKDFYKPFHKTVEKTTEHSERQSGERELGIDPVSKKKVIVRIGRFGPLAQIGETNEEKGLKATFAGLRKDQRMETITLEQALLLFKMPRVVGEFEGKEMKVGIGRFGPYVVHNNAFTSLGKEEDPYTIGAERCIELIKAKREKDAAKIIKTFPENPNLKVLHGRWGPCIVLGKDFFRIPKDKEPVKLSFGEIVDIIGGMDAYEQVIKNAETKAKKFGPKKAKGETKSKTPKGKAAKVVELKKPSKKVTIKKPLFKKAASKSTAPKRVIKATRKKAAKRK